MSKLKQLPEDCTFPQLAVVFDPPRFAACLQAGLGGEFAAGELEVRAVKVKRLYYKPGRSCRMILEAKVRGRDGRKGRQQYFGKIAPEPKPASLYRRALQAPLAPPEFGPPVALLADLGLVLWAYPTIPTCRASRPWRARQRWRHCCAPIPRASAWPAGGELVDLRLGVGKYVPGQRCGYRYRARWRNGSGEREHHFYGKAYQEGVGGPAHDVLRADCRVRSLPQRPPARAAALTATIRRAKSSGRRCCPAARSRKTRASWTWWPPPGRWRRRLGAFHAASLDLGPGLGLAAEIDALVRVDREDRAAYPADAARFAALQARLLAAVPGLPAVPPAPVHGSFKISHVFDAGGQVAFIDFDGAGIGDPTYDVGRFLAHLTVAGHRSARPMRRRMRTRAWKLPCRLRRRGAVGLARRAGALVHGRAPGVEPGVQVRETHGSRPRRGHPRRRRSSGSPRCEGGTMVDIKDVPRDAGAALAARRRSTANRCASACSRISARRWRSCR